MDKAQLLPSFPPHLQGCMIRDLGFSVGQPSSCLPSFSTMTPFGQDSGLELMGLPGGWLVLCLSMFVLKNSMSRILGTLPGKTHVLGWIS